MTISVIIPVHNSSEYLDDCIMSVIQQMQGMDEIVLVENGSTDNSYDLCQKYAHNYPCVRCFDVGNKGVSVARNYGIDVAKGEWIVFLDADDKLQINALNILRHVANRSIDIIIAEYSNQDIFSRTFTVCREVPPMLLAKGVLRYPVYQKKIGVYAQIDYFSIWSCWAKFFRKDFLNHKCIRFPQGVRLSEDAAFCFQAYCAASSIYSINQVTYFYRSNPNSTIRGKWRDLTENNVALLQNFETYRKQYCNRKWDNMFSAYYIGKIVDAFLRNQTNMVMKKYEVIDRFMEIEGIKKRILRAPFSRLVLGKRNTIIYARALLEIKWYVIRLRRKR